MDVLLEGKNRKHNEIIKTTFCFLTSATRLVTTATWLKLATDIPEAYTLLKMPNCKL